MQEKVFDTKCRVLAVITPIKLSDVQIECVGLRPCRPPCKLLHIENCLVLLNLLVAKQSSKALN